MNLKKFPLADIPLLMLLVFTNIVAGQVLFRFLFVEDDADAASDADASDASDDEDDADLMININIK